ncbi:hypothetical protein NC652_039267 [Populus alba x Populus x berolinensis]|nr:hypothetical protein NC652_039267 [Populus alba x Populus x berolinensis]
MVMIVVVATSTSSFIRLHQRLSHSSSARPAVADSTESSGSSSSTVTPFHSSSIDFCTVSSSGRSLSPAASSFSSSSNSALLSTIVDLSI